MAAAAAAATRETEVVGESRRPSPIPANSPAKPIFAATLPTTPWRVSETSVDDPSWPTLRVSLGRRCGCCRRWCWWCWCWCCWWWSVDTAVPRSGLVRSSRDEAWSSWSSQLLLRRRELRTTRGREEDGHHRPVARAAPETGNAQEATKEASMVQIVPAALGYILRHITSQQHPSKRRRQTLS